MSLIIETRDVLLESYPRIPTNPPAYINEQHKAEDLYTQLKNEFLEGKDEGKPLTERVQISEYPLEVSARNGRMVSVLKDGVHIQSKL
jgi:hypothetical protein